MPKKKNIVRWILKRNLSLAKSFISSSCKDVSSLAPRPVTFDPAFQSVPGDAVWVQHRVRVTAGFGSRHPGPRRPHAALTFSQAEELKLSAGQPLMTSAIPLPPPFHSSRMATGWLVGGGGGEGEGRFHSGELSIRDFIGVYVFVSSFIGVSELILLSVGFCLFVCLSFWLDLLSNIPVLASY